MQSRCKAYMVPSYPGYFELASNKECYETYRCSKLHCIDVLTYHSGKKNMVHPHLNQRTSAITLAELCHFTH